MSKGHDIPDNEAEFYLDGRLPVQFFTTQAIAILPNMILEPRLGRPVRNPHNTNGLGIEDSKDLSNPLR